MARIAVEDSLKNVPNLFELVCWCRLSAARASWRTAPRRRSIGKTASPTVLALREIAAGHVGVEILEENRKCRLLRRRS